MTARRPDRGASLVEYALGIALIGLAIVGALQALESDSSEALGDRTALAGDPSEDFGVLGNAGGGSPVSTATTVTTTSIPATPVDVDIVGSPTAVISGPGNSGKWSATVTFSVTSLLGGGGISGAIVDGTWSVSGGGVDLVAACSSVDGVCAVVANDIGSGVTSVTFTVTSVSGTGVAGGDLPVVTVCKPGVVCEPPETEP